MTPDPKDAQEDSVNPPPARGRAEGVAEHVAAGEAQRPGSSGPRKITLLQITSTLWEIESMCESLREMLHCMDPRTEIVIPPDLRFPNYGGGGGTTPRLFAGCPPAEAESKGPVMFAGCPPPEAENKGPVMFAGCPPPETEMAKAPSTTTPPSTGATPSSNPPTGTGRPA